MSSCVAFMRAVNVAGHAKVEMRAVRDAFAAAGCRDVRSYIQSGNVIFELSAARSPAVTQRIRGMLRELLGEEPVLLLRTAREVQQIVTASPFYGRASDPAVKRYVAFLSRTPRVRLDLPLRTPAERLEVVAIVHREVYIVSRRKKNGFYGIPNIFVEKELGVPATCRNWSTVTKLAELLQPATSG
jgi:uncharacterized protein (DUF1697 family)